MADRTSAAVFGRVFQLLAKNPTDENKKMARTLWKDSMGYDFSPEQMRCDTALKKLDLAQRGVDPECPEDGMTTIYGPVKKRRTPAEPSSP